MPRRRYWGGTGARANRAVPKPIKVVAPKIEAAGLSRAYDWFLFDKIFGVRMAIEWYAENYKKLLFNDALDETRQKAYDRAIKSKAIGDSTSEPGERLQAWSTALKLYDKVWGAAKNLPTFAETDKRADAGEKPSAGVANVITVLNNLNAAFQTLGVTFAPSLAGERHNDGKQIMLPVTELDTLVTQSPLKTALAEVPGVAKVASIVLVGGDAANGVAAHEELDGEKFFANLPLALENVYTWAAAAAGSTITRPVGKAAKPSKTSGNGVPKTAPAGGSVSRARLFSDNDVITVINPANPFKGILAKRYALIKNGMTIRQFKAARKTANLGDFGCGIIKKAQAMGYISVA